MSATLTYSRSYLMLVFDYFFMVVVVVRCETTATVSWALLFIVRAFFNDTITVAVWTGFHVRLMGMLSQLRDYIRRCFADPPIAAEFASGFDASNSLK